LEAAGPHHHAVAAYASDDFDHDPTASLLAALRVAPLRVPPGPDAAETALLAHAQRMRAEGCTHFTVCSSDRTFAALADTDAVHLDVLIWHGQPVSARLERAAAQVRRLPRPGTPDTDTEPPIPACEPTHDGTVRDPRRRLSGPLSSLAAGVLIGLGIAVGHRVADLFLPRVRHRQPPRQRTVFTRDG
jgi:hypothetical protein